MRGVLGRGTGVALVIAGACAASCSSHREEAREAVAFKRQSIHEAVKRRSARKVCQLIGDIDHETGTETWSKTNSRFGIDDTDLGYPVAQGHRTWFFFGDVTPADDIDPLGYMDEKPDPNDETKCPKLEFTAQVKNAAAQALTLHCDEPGLKLDGPLVRGGNGFNVPTGFTFDPVGNRLIGLFAFGLGVMDDPSKVTPVLAESSLAEGHPVKDFTCIPTVLSAMSAQFSIIAPWIADVNELGYGFLPGEGCQVLLVWGTGVPFRRTGVRLAAVRLKEVQNATSWRFFKGGSDDPEIAWLKIQSGNLVASLNKIALETAEIASQGSAGEISVSYDPTFRQWRMVHGLSSAQLNPAERGDLRLSPAFNMTIMRTAPRPEGPWTHAHPLYIMKDMGQPSWGDEGQGRFLHHENPRIWKSAQSADLVPLSADPRPLPSFPPTCATSFPDYCTSIDTRQSQDINDPLKGCCTRSDRCCDLAFHFDRGPGPGSWRPGVPYAQYLIPSFTQDRRLSNPTSLLPDEQRVFWVVSTLNPYVVNLMSTELAFRDWDQDGVPNDEDNCKLTWNPGQENCNEEAELALEARLGRPVEKLGDACDPVPCPKATMEVRRDKLAITTGNCGDNPYSPNVCIGRAIRNEIAHAPLGAGLDERLLSAPNTGTKALTKVAAVRTHARFCQSNLDLGFNCNAAATKGDAEVTFWPSAAAERADPLHPGTASRSRATSAERSGAS